jgi:hypothetical protein
MSDNHTGLPHDLPEYEPNWPAAVRVKAQVYRLPSGWAWSHDCPRKGWVFLGFPRTTHAVAFVAALKHARGCW